MFPFVGWFWIVFFCTQPPSDTKTCQGIQKNLRFQPVKVSVEVISRSSYSGLKIEQKNCRKMQFYTRSYKIDSKMVRNRDFLVEKLEKIVEKYHRELQNWC